MAVGAVLGLIVGWLRRGRFSHLALLDFPLWWLIILAFFVQAVIPRLVSSVDYDYLLIAYLASFGMVAAALAANIKRRYVALILTGVLMNATVIALNQGMPYYTDLLLVQVDDAPPIRGLYHKANDDTIAGFLGDWMAVPPPYPQPAIISPGDLLISLGLLLFIQHEMTRKRTFQPSPSCETG